MLKLSIPTSISADLVELGRRLRSLREQGVLAIGSGFMTHRLPFIDGVCRESVPGWSRDFDAWATDALARGDLDELAAFRTRAHGMPYAHPTVERFIPMLPALGASTDLTVAPETIDSWKHRLSRRSLQVA